MNIINKQITEIREKQKRFQALVDFPVDSVLAKDRNEISEKYIFKMIEEAIELRKEFPSVINPWSKTQKRENTQRIKEELSDVILFLVNFINVWKFTDEEVLEAIENVQTANFQNIKRKKMNVLNSDILKIPGPVSIGQGNISPKYLFVGQNPSEKIPNGYQSWSWHEEGETPESTKILRNALREISLDEDSYFTDLVKETTPKNSEPTPILVSFWQDFLNNEIELLRVENSNMKIVALGSFVSAVLEKAGIEHLKITHPAAILRGDMSREDYLEEISKTL